MSSQSLRRLELRLKDINEIKAAHDAASGGPKKGRHWNTQSLDRGAIVLLCAHFEGFLEDIFEESVRALERSGIQSMKVPLPLVLGLIAQDCRVLAHSKNVQERSAVLGRLKKRLEPFLDPTRTLHPADIDPEVVIESLENPTVEHVVSFFANLGIERIFDGIAWKSASNAAVRQNVDLMVDLRNRIAHGEKAVPVVWADVSRSMRYVTGVSKKIDRILRGHLSLVTGTQPWPA